MRASRMSAGVPGREGDAPHKVRGYGDDSDRQAAAHGGQPWRQRPAHRRGAAAGLAASRPAREVGDEGSRAARHRFADEEHRAGTVPAGIAGAGGGRLRLRLRRQGPVPRLDLQAAGPHGDGAAADSRRSAEHGAVGDAAGLEGAAPPPERAGARDRADRFRQVDDAGRLHRLSERELRPSHHHDRRPDRILPLPQEIDGQPARGGRRRALVRRGDPPRCGRTRT